MPGIFISYRRQDSAGHSGRLYDRLAAEFGHDHVFMDVERIAGGEDFASVIDDRLRRCDVCLVVIGQRWLTSADRYGRRRLDRPEDWVRMEVAAALTRSSIRVIPLLVDDAPLPEEEALPGDLVRLPHLNAMEINHYSFHQNVDRLIEVIHAAADARRAALEPGAIHAPGTVRIHPVDGLEYVWVPPGDFRMGRVPKDKLTAEKYGDEKPQHPIRLTRGFWLSRVPVTVAAYKRFAKGREIEMPRSPQDNPNWASYEHPIVNVTWAQAREYCAWVGGRLPTEAQWEYAARGGKADTIYPWGDTIAPENANYVDNHAWEGSSPVGQFPANGFNLYDMVGNVWQWVADWYDGEVYASRPPHEPTEDPQVYTNKTDKRVVRGGSWDSIEVEVRISNRGFQTPLDGFRDFGFRCLVEELPEETEDEPAQAASSSNSSR